MFDMALYAEVKRLLDAVAEIEDALMPHEVETYRALADKYAEPVNPEPTDVTCLDVLLRNVQIRKGYRIDPKADSGRVIELERRRRGGTS